MSNALEKGIALGKANRRKEAIQYLTQALIENPKEIEAWMWISQLVDDRPTQKYCYKRILEVDPNHFMAKQFSGFLNGTDANLKFFPDPVSPLQTFFENQQARQPQPQVGKPFPESVPNPNIRPAVASAQNSRPVRPQDKLKKKRTPSWIIYILFFLIFNCLLSAGIVFTQTYLPSEINFSFGTDPFFSNPITIGLMILWCLVGTIWGISWMISGYIGVVNLIKKGYFFEYIGCSLLLVGVPLILPALLGPIMHPLVDSIGEKNR